MMNIGGLINGSLECFAMVRKSLMEILSKRVNVFLHYQSTLTVNKHVGIVLHRPVLYAEVGQKIFSKNGEKDQLNNVLSSLMYYL